MVYWLKRLPHMWSSWVSTPITLNLRCKKKVVIPSLPAARQFMEESGLVDLVSVQCGWVGSGFSGYSRCSSDTALQTGHLAHCHNLLISGHYLDTILTLLKVKWHQLANQTSKLYDLIIN